ncbi:MAG: hypothetical protein E7658_02550 [Ruminococcaceae bacterium]|nr:hypothetical protein [Oscillospiraceae bacterium]
MAEKNIDKNEIVSTVNGSFVMYRNRPLVREENIICYGSMDEKYMLQMTIMSTKDYKGQSVPDKVVVQLMNTDTNVPSHKRIVKQAIEDGLDKAMELGIIWLERYLAS